MYVENYILYCWLQNLQIGRIWLTLVMHAFVWDIQALYRAGLKCGAYHIDRSTRNLCVMVHARAHACWFGGHLMLV